MFYKIYSKQVVIIGDLKKERIFVLYLSEDEVQNKASFLKGEMYDYFRN
jgi:hypothetical protein